MPDPSAVIPVGLLILGLILLARAWRRRTRRAKATAGQGRPDTRPPRARTPRTRATAGRRRTPARRSERPYWQERGWRRNGNRLVGYYRTPYGSFQGEIVLGGGRPMFYIFKPPAELKDSPHWPCFQHRGSGKYSIHFKSPRVADENAGILAVERILRDALEGG